MACVLGVDIGYSNLKVAVGSEDGSVPELGRGALVVPSGAAPADRVGKAVFGADKGVEVLVGGRPWMAGVPQDSIMQWHRTLDERYPESDQYLALYLAALRLAKVETVDLLVTGLPVNQFSDQKFRRKLQERLTGHFEVGGGRRALVNRVMIVPQPIGGFSEVVHQDPALAEEAVLVIDPGFFSVDWVLVNKGQYLAELCSSSNHAVSMVVERVLKQLNEQGIALRQVEMIEEALRSNRKDIKLGGRTVDLDQLLSRVSAEVARTAMAAVLGSLRSWGRKPDRVVLVGGGAKLFEAAVRQAFEPETVRTLPAPVLANARGFWLYGTAKLVPASA
ncbi:MAG TPA: ParM/StbA family protein [Nevskia sp.]|nr:ParM/StbA family protein [Nevskia sp.]